MTELSLYNNARAALAECHAIDEVKEIRDKAMAMRLYAQQACDTTLEKQAYEIRHRAERRLGQLMRQLEKAKGPPTLGDRSQREIAKELGVDQRTVGRNSPASTGFPNNPVEAADRAPTLASQGIDKNLAHKSRKLAAMPDEEFEEWLKDRKAARAYTHPPKREGEITLQSVLNQLVVVKMALKALITDPQEPDELKELEKSLASIQELVPKLTRKNGEVVWIRKQTGS
jgi:hypothetical protein